MSLLNVNEIGASTGTTLKLKEQTIQIQDDSSNNMISASQGGAVVLAHSTSAKLSTTSDGVDINDGNITFATASKGIHLGVTTPTASNLLDDYEEGVWTPALGNFGGSNESFIDPRYTKIGRLVTVSCQLQIGSFPSDGSTFLITGLPFTVKSGSGTTFGTVPFRQTNTTIMGLTIGDNNTQIEMYEVGNGGGQFNYNDFGQSKQMAFVAQYETA